MKKSGLKAVNLFILVALTVVFSDQTKAGPLCDAAGGTCLPAGECVEGNVADGANDCSVETPFCCVCKKDGERVGTAAQCCSNDAVFEDNPGGTHLPSILVCNGSDIACKNAGESVSDERQCCSKNAVLEQNPRGSNLPPITVCTDTPEVCKTDGEIVSSASDCCSLTTRVHSQESMRTIFECAGNEPPEGCAGDGVVTDQLCTGCCSGSCKLAGNSTNIYACAGGVSTGDYVGNLSVKYKGPPIKIEELFQKIYDIAIPATVGIALYFIIKAGYVLKTSDGNPDIVRQGKESLTAAIIGLLFISLSLTILKIIMSTVLGG